MGIDFCNKSEREFYFQLFNTKRDLDIRPLYFYLCPVIIFICFFSIIFNAILMSISRQSKVVNKSPILLLSLNLAVTDLIASLLNGLGILLNSYLPEVYDIKMGLCSMLMFEVVRYAALVASALHLLALAFVHYRGIVNPLHYRSTIFFSQHLSRTINIISIVCWIIPLTIMIAWFSSSPCQGFQTTNCDYLFLMGFTFRYMVLTLFALPLILMSVIYLRIFIIISRHQKGRRLNHERSTLTRGVISATGPTCAAATAVNLPELMESRNDNSNIIVGVTVPGESGIARCAYCLARALQDANSGEVDGDADDDDDQATVAILDSGNKLLSVTDSHNNNGDNGNKRPTTMVGNTIEFDEESHHRSQRTRRSQHKTDHQSYLDTNISTPPEAKRSITTAKESSVSNWSQSSNSHGSSSGILQKSNSTPENQTTKEETNNNNDSSSSSRSGSGSRSDDGSGSSNNSSNDEDNNDSKSSSSNDEEEDGLNGLLVPEINGNSRRQSDKHVLLRSPGSQTKKKKGFVMTTVGNNNHKGTFLCGNKGHPIASAIGGSTFFPLGNQYSSAQQQNVVATNKSTAAITISPFNDCDIDNGNNQQQLQQQHCTDESALLNVVSSNPRIIHQQQNAPSGKSLLSRLNPENLIKKQGKVEGPLKESKDEVDGGNSDGSSGHDNDGEFSTSITTDATTATTVRSLQTSTSPTTTMTKMAKSETMRATRRTVSLLDTNNQQLNDYDNLKETKASSNKSGSGDGVKAIGPKTALRAQFSLVPQQQQQQVSSKEVRLLTLPASSRDMGTNQNNRRAMEQKSLDLQQRRSEIQTSTPYSAVTNNAISAAGRFHKLKQKAITLSSDSSPTWECTCDNKLRQLNAKLSRSNTIGDTSGNSQATGSATNRTILSISTSQRSSISSSSVARQSFKSQQFRRSPTIVSGDQQGDLRSTSTFGPNAPATAAVTNSSPSSTDITKQNHQPASASSSAIATLVARQPNQPTTTTNHNNCSFATTNLTGTASSTYEPQRRHFHSSAVPQTNTKALVTTLLILGTYFISYAPAIIFQVLTCIDNCPYPLHNISFSRRILVGAMTNLLLIAKSIIDPFIYSYRMSEIQVAINRYLSKRRISKSSHAVSMHYTSQRLNTGGCGGGGSQTNFPNNASHHHHHHHHPHHHHHSSRNQQLNKQYQLNNFNISSTANRTNNSFNMTINDKSSGSGNGNGCDTTKQQVSDTS